MTKVVILRNRGSSVICLGLVGKFLMLDVLGETTKKLELIGILITILHKQLTMCYCKKRDEVSNKSEMILT